MRHSRFLTLAAFLIAGCAATAVDDPVRGASITLLPGQTAALSRTISLRYDTVADSRCPTDARCVWAGMVIYRLTLGTVRGKESFALHKDAPAAVLGGLRIAIGQAVEPPRGATGDAPAPHPVTFTITSETP
ncbi:MAG: hypothetical protein Q7S67_00180 [Telluria sp.]|nr:hypothetical protein [Telluria sp.]